MLLSAGPNSGPIEILALVGEGGMGQVWKARDTRLDRTVAIKTSHQQFNERFEREARAIAALNHPHICSLYDVGIAGCFLSGDGVRRGRTALRTAAARRGAAAVGADSGCARRRAPQGHHASRSQAREYSGDQERSQRCSTSGLPKIDHGPGAGAKPAATETMPLTSEGAFMGTLPYMAPEQIEGKEADARSDIFAFGVVLYELIAGKAPVQRVPPSPA